MAGQPLAPRRLALQLAAVVLYALMKGRASAQTPPAPGAAPAHPDAERAKGGPLPALGSRLALPEVPMLDGSMFKPADADGQVLVLYWWASWCPFCAIQSPMMNQLWLEQQPRGLRFLGLSIDRKPEDALAYLQRRGYRFPSGWVSPAVAQALPRPRGLPVTLVRGREGQVLMAEAGQLFPEDVAGIARFLHGGKG